MTQSELDQYYLKVATICSKNSKARRLQVGAILVKDQQIISDGFNGTPRSFDNNCEWEKCKSGFFDDEEIEKSSEKNLVEKTFPGKLSCKRYKENLTCAGCTNLVLKTIPYVLHAEANCLMKTLRHGSVISTVGSTIYITHAPCIECSKLIVQAGITRVVYANAYKTTQGIDLLKKAGIQVDEIAIDNEMF